MPPKTPPPEPIALRADDPELDGQTAHFSLSAKYPLAERYALEKVHQCSASVMSLRLDCLEIAASSSEFWYCFLRETRVPALCSSNEGKGKKASGRGSPDPALLYPRAVPENSQ